MTFKEISVKIIPHHLQIYDTCGNYRIVDGDLLIEISDTGNFFYNMLVLVHELVEIIQVIKAGIKFKDIDNWDIKFERDRTAGLHRNTAEPGDDPKSPYYKAHKFATKVERLLCACLGLSWVKYNNALYSLEWKENDVQSYGGI